MSEKELRIRVLGESVLRKKTKKVSKVTPEHQKLLSKMARFMYDSSGIGLAAPQVGISESLIVVDAGNGLYKLINPVIVNKKGRQVLAEGCLSLPGISVEVKRAKKVMVEALNEKGVPVIIEAKDLLACVFQHEIDHLMGKLIIDYVPFFKKFLIKRKIKKI